MLPLGGAKQTAYRATVRKPTERLKPVVRRDVSRSADMAVSN